MTGGPRCGAFSRLLHAPRWFATSGYERSQGAELKGALQRVAPDGGGDVIVTRLFKSTVHYLAPHTWREQSPRPGSFEAPPPGFQAASKLSFLTLI